MCQLLYYISVILKAIMLLRLLSFNGKALAQQQPQQLPEECGKLNETQFYNGKGETALSEYPWLGLLGRNHRNEPVSYYCVAILISQRYIIVPAQCIADIGESIVLSVVFARERVYYLKEIVPHYQYNFGMENNDIGLAKLRENVEFTDFLQPICLPSANERDDRYIGQRLELAGYQFNKREKLDVNQSRIKTFIHSTSHEYCKNGKFFNISNTQMCAYILGNRALISGSAVMGVNVVDGKPKNFYLTGILIFGKFVKGQPDQSAPVLIQRVAPFKDLIVQNMI